MRGRRTQAVRRCSLEWRAFFDGMADTLVGKRVEVEAASLDLGDQIVTEWVPLLGVTYDTRDDLLDVALSGLNHLIRRPRDIYVPGRAQGRRDSRGRFGRWREADPASEGSAHATRW